MNFEEALAEAKRVADVLAQHFDVDAAPSQHVLNEFVVSTTPRAIFVRVVSYNRHARVREYRIEVEVQPMFTRLNFCTVRKNWGVKAFETVIDQIERVSKYDVNAIKRNLWMK